MSASEAETSGYDPTYRQQEVDDTLDDHDRRITRLEKVMLVVLGYGLAQGSTLVTDLTTFVF